MARRPTGSKEWGVLVTLLTAIALLVLYATGHLPVGQGRAQEGQVVAVLDGDTIEVMEQGKAVRIRLYGVDAPEKSQPYGMQAKKFTSEQCFGKTVTLKVKDRDRYGRTVSEVILPDGRSLNRELVRNGYAWWYRQYSRDPSLGELEEEARRAHRGLWADKSPEPPWEYRKEQREGREAPAGSHRGRGR